MKGEYSCTGRWLGGRRNTSYKRILFHLTNRKNYKELGSVDITKFEKIAPYAGKYADEAESAEYDKVYDFSSSPNDPYVFYAIEYDEENNTKTLYLFNASEKMLRLIKLYNRRAITEYPNE